MFHFDFWFKSSRLPDYSVTSSLSHNCCTFLFSVFRFTAVKYLKAVLSMCVCVYTGELSVDGIRSLLTSSWLLLHHFPNPALYPHVCSLLAQSLGPSDPVTTAMLHAQSLGVSSRHHMTRHLANRLRYVEQAVFIFLIHGFLFVLLKMLETFQAFTVLHIEFTALLNLL